MSGREPCRAWRAAESSAQVIIKSPCAPVSRRIAIARTPADSRRSDGIRRPRLRQQAVTAGEKSPSTACPLVQGANLLKFGPRTLLGVRRCNNLAAARRLQRILLTRKRIMAKRVLLIAAIICIVDQCFAMSVNNNVSKSNTLVHQVDSACGGYKQGDCRKCERQTPYPDYKCYEDASCDPCVAGENEPPQKKATDKKK